MAQHLRTLVALAEDLGLIPSTYRVTLGLPQPSFSLLLLFWGCLGLEPRVSGILGKHFTPELYPQPSSYFLCHGLAGLAAQFGLELFLQLNDP